MDIPRWCYRVSMRVRSLLRGGALDRDLDEELQFHVEQLVEANLAQGLSPEAARRNALLAIGGLEQRKEECRDVRRVRLVGDLIQDLRYASRTLRVSPGFAMASIVTLGLGIGTTVAMFAVVDGVLLRPLPFPEPDRLLLASVSPRNFFMRSPGMADRTYLAFRERDRAFQYLAAFTSYNGNLTGAGDPAVITVGHVTTEFFDAVGVPAAIGRTFIAGDGQEGREQTVVLSDQLWKTRFGGNPTIVGTRVTLDGVPRTVIGVMPDGFDSPRSSTAWTPFAIKLEPGNSLLFPVLGRLKPGITLAQARASFEASLATLPDGPGEDRSQWLVGLLPLKELLVGDIRRPLQIFSGAVLLVLLIACANVANLLLARASGREREIAVRAALGASRRRLVRQLLTESALLSLIGAAAGLLLARWTVPLLLAFAPAGRIPRTDTIRFDGWVIAFALTAAGGAAIFFGLAPALHLTRRRFSGALLPGGRAAMREQERFRAALVVGEIALALVLLTGAGLLAKSFLRLRAVDPGFNSTNVVCLSVELPRSMYHSAEQLQAFHEDMLARLAALPGVAAAGMVNWLPLGNQHLSGDFVIEGAAQNPRFNVDKTVASPGYFSAMGIRLLRGREFNIQDRASGLAVAIVSRSVARAIDPSEDVIGKRVSIWGQPDRPSWLTIVAVVNDVKQLGPSQDSHPAIYQPYLQAGREFLLSQMTYVVRTNDEPLAIIPSLRAVLRAVDHDQPATRIGLMRDVLDAATAEPGFYARLLGTFALMAVTLALIGIYGVIAYSVAQRTHEIGLRMALGAGDRSVLWLVIRRTLILGGSGVLLGAIGALTVTRLLEAFLFEITPTDPATFAAVAVIVFTSALLAGFIPGRRAIRIDPLAALRHE